MIQIYKTLGEGYPLLNRQDFNKKASISKETDAFHLGNAI
jgi:hypothetical protein